MGKLLRYLKYSNFKVSFDLNPFVWSFKGAYQRPTRTDPHLRIWYLRVLPVSITVVIDDGVALPEDWMASLQMQVDHIVDDINDDH